MWVSFKSVIFFVFMLLFFKFNRAFAQSDTLALNKKNSSFTSELNIDIKSSYYWRGAFSDPKPCIQPTYEIKFRNLGFEFFGSNGFDNSYQELDWSLSYQLNAFKIAVSDYYYDFSKKYFDYSIHNPHLIDASIQYEIGTENVFSILFSTIVWGADKYKDYNIGISNAQNYSSYIEASYAIDLERSSYLFSMGATPYNGIYADKLDIVNLGLEYEKRVDVTENYSFTPIFGIWVNPSSSMVFFSCGIRL